MSFVCVVLLLLYQFHEQILKISGFCFWLLEFVLGFMFISFLKIHFTHVLFQLPIYHVLVAIIVLLVKMKLTESSRSFRFIV